ncbi:bifunctional diaminohydroxyphosphoribosylaminopyrimidine deaminase/5-amino-6-(5-phosphoribosylamino)uracil reductase RibD [Roseateles saccharophilus]|uniref:Riboflavin biosynthesis protein RibD n=1 Tax=Roseateles saccharophilus TaxID=304 RepID=A0A4R3URC4_ROSSA|nr:bifunctional diaminohydroxyphosphoribosylaminopyrimidine deaminase/5-amino-6-(5-phosphoribosylamino)uracil reductase RibD [Roseateles saccharophilus]MDG0833653.1 bifunctional diaminohydroxyphosphoribosylaminopyrimidine deaminase/5-amino-6-(5-phosphoribosylamino)uracil reductase RibD [Roseateles saccharophilus]TCU93240.1 diaminohydroxyphosphoribosylaminopyrimidine deaminase/5-amino-6-(5-phosphoribosylamino)uracil reductase [Roseateles saccharophilus]
MPAPDIPAALHQALALAESAIGLTDPNPRVGCVILSADGAVLGAGHTQPAGQAHAEIMALRDAASRGHDLRGATAVVTLEPCSHQGRTPPCCDALIAAGIARVVAAIEDPNPEVAGRGLARMRAAGIAVELADADLADAAREINIGFFSRMQRARPFVRLKSAISLDGRTALPDGRSQWITGAAARTDGHAWRRRAGAVLTGIGTVLADDPRMDVRLVPTAKQPLRIILDPQGRMPAAARILQPPGEVRVVGPGRADLAALLTELGTQGINELHVEAGPTLSGAFIDAGLVDELLVYQAPMLIGEGRPLAQLAALAGLDEARRWRRVEATAVGQDLRLRFRPT